MNQKSSYAFRLVLGVWLTYLGISLLYQMYKERPSNMVLISAIAVVFVIVGAVCAIHSLLKIFGIRMPKLFRNFKKKKTEKSEEPKVQQFIPTNSNVQPVALTAVGESSQAEKLYVPGTELLNPQAFAEKLAFMQEQQEGGFSRYTLAQVTPEKDYTAGQVSESLCSLIRISDYMGQDEDGKYWVILTNTLPEQVEGLQQRFAKKGLRVEVPVR